MRAGSVCQGQSSGGWVCMPAQCARDKATAGGCACWFSVPGTKQWQVGAVSRFWALKLTCIKPVACQGTCFSRCTSKSILITSHQVSTCTSAESDMNTSWLIRSLLYKLNESRVDWPTIALLPLHPSASGDAVFAYVASAGLDAPDPSLVVLDVTLCDALFKGVIKKGATGTAARLHPFM